MRVKVRVTGQLIDICSADHVDLADGASVDQALAQLNIPHDQVGLVSVNGEAVSKAKRPHRALADGDELVVMAPLTGG
ncbi:MAG: MoaD/ThiS family protein [Proteobacteria bacterium]|nr:MoaD/ThiS family protein [Pseudomonadota bacterium]HJP06275.1 MoaD/ThiS family protein [Arenicellales bacterium]